MYTFEWDSDFSFGLNIPNFHYRFQHIASSEKKNIIFIKNEFDDSCFRYRAYNMIQSMKNNEKYTLDCFLYEEMTALYDILDKIDLVILQRTFWIYELESFITTLKNNNIKVIFDIDDLIYSPKYIPNLLNSNGNYNEAEINYLFGYSKRLETIAEMCDGFIVTTESLCDHMKEDFNKPTWIFHNFLNLEQQNAAKNIINLKKKTYSNDKFFIGYFSGSNSHKRDLEIVETALLKLMKKYDDIYLIIVGYMELNYELQKLKENGRIILSQFVTFEELEYKIGKVDLNIIPLQKHEFNECKSELKYFEASIVNTLSCATDNTVYKNIIKDGVDGFLSNEVSWFDKIEYIYLNYSNLTHITDSARNKCLKEYANQNQEKLIERLYDEILNFKFNY